MNDAFESQDMQVAPDDDPSNATSGNAIGLVGVGAIGGAICQFLCHGGKTVWVADISQAALTAAASYGAQVAESPKEVASRADVVLTFLPYAENVEEVLFGDSGIASGATERTIVIEASTIDPRSVQRFGERLSACGSQLLDAGISASPRMAVTGKGTLFVGGRREVFDTCQETLKSVFPNGQVVFVGELGSAKVMKLINNMVGAVQMVAISEAFDVGISAGLEPGAVFEGMRLGMAECWALRVRPPLPGLVAGSPADADFAADFPLDYMLKDLEYFNQTARSLGSTPFVAGMVREMYGLASRMGMGQKDFAAISLLAKPRSEMKGLVEPKGSASEGSEQ